MAFDSSLLQGDGIYFYVTFPLRGPGDIQRIFVYWPFFRSDIMLENIDSFTSFGWKEIKIDEIPSVVLNNNILYA